MRFALLLLLTCVCSAQTSQFALTEQPGPHAVGLKVVEQYADTRTFHSRPDVLGHPLPGELARPIQTLIWYPAEPSTAAKVTVAD